MCNRKMVVTLLQHQKSTHPSLTCSAKRNWRASSKHYRTPMLGRLLIFCPNLQVIYKSSSNKIYHSVSQRCTIALKNCLIFNYRSERNTGNSCQRKRRDRSHEVRPLSRPPKVLGKIYNFVKKLERVFWRTEFVARCDATSSKEH